MKKKEMSCQILACVLVLSLAFPAFSKPDIVGQAVYSQSATVREGPLTLGSTLFNGDTVSVRDKGFARIAVTGGGQIDVLGRSAVRLTRNQSAVQFSVEHGSAIFRSEPGSSLEVLMPDATIRSAPGSAAVGIVGYEAPDSAIVVARLGALEITSMHDAKSFLVPEGSAARLTFIPDPQVVPPAGRASPLGSYNHRKLVIIALFLGGGTVLAALLLGGDEKKQTIQTLTDEISPFKLQ